MAYYRCGGGGISAYTVEGDYAYDANDEKITETVANTVYTIKTGLTTVTRFRWFAKATANATFQLIDYDTNRTNANQHVILNSGTSAYGSAFYAGANGAASQYRAAITGISGGDITIKTSSNATYGKVNFTWQAG